MLNSHKVTAQVFGGTCWPIYEDSSLILDETYTHPADCAIAYTLTLADFTSVGLTFRRVDDNNLWYLKIDANGGGSLEKRTSGSFAGQLVFSAATFSDTDRVAVYMKGSFIGVYNNGTLLDSVSSSSYATATTGKMLVLGAGGACNNLKVWGPRCRGQESIP